MDTMQEARTSSKRRRSRLSNSVPRMSAPHCRRWRHEPQTFPYPPHDRRAAWMSSPGAASSWGSQSNGPGLLVVEVHHETVHMVRPAPPSDIFGLRRETREPGPAWTNPENHQFLKPEPLLPSVPSTGQTRSGSGKKPVLVWPEEEEQVVEFAANFRSAEPEPSEKSSSSFCGPLALRLGANTEGVRWKSSRSSQRAQTWDEATRTRAGHHFRPNINELHLHLEALLQPPSIHDYLYQMPNFATPRNAPLIPQEHFVHAAQPRASNAAPAIEIPPSIANIQAECLRVAQEIVAIRQTQQQDFVILRQSELVYDEESIIHAQHELASLQAQEQALLEHFQGLQMALRMQLDMNRASEVEVHRDRMRGGNMNFLSGEVNEDDEHEERWYPCGYGRIVDLDLDRLSLEEEDEYHSSAHSDGEYPCTDPECRLFEEDNLEHHPPRYEEDYHPQGQQSFHSLFSNIKSMNAYPLINIDSSTFSNAAAQFRTYEHCWRSILSSAPSTSSSSTSKSTPTSPNNQSNESENKNQNTSTQIPYPLLSPPPSISFPPILTDYIAASPTFISKAASHTFFCLSFSLTPTIIPPPLFSTSASNPSTMPTLSFDFPPSPTRPWPRDPEGEKAEREERRKKLEGLRAQLKREKAHWHSDRLTLYFGSEAAKTEKAKSVWSVVVELKKGVDSAIEKMDRETELA